ncbi:MAG: hypothetical protein ACRDV6_01295 [Acidimicrobiales bacterium]
MTDPPAAEVEEKPTAEVPVVVAEATAAPEPGDKDGRSPPPSATEAIAAPERPATQGTELPAASTEISVEPPGSEHALTEATAAPESADADGTSAAPTAADAIVTAEPPAVAGPEPLGAAAEVPAAAPIAVVTGTDDVDSPDEADGTRRRFRKNRTRPRHRKSRWSRRFVLSALGAVVVLFGAAAIVVAVRLHVRPPLAVLRPTITSSRVVGGGPPVIPWPAGVQSAIAIPALGVTAQSGSETPAPIASVTKLMTAHVVLTDHPLTVGEDGPSITITPNDVALYEDDVAAGQTNIEVAVGEELTEHQLLQGMLIHSANNFADLLAIFDAGSVSAFVTKMNAAAASLDMRQTAYSDASGYSTASVSTPTDQLKVATMDVADPVFDQIVEMTSVTLPVAGTVGSYTPYLGTDGVVGVKSGFTSAAGGCDVLALLEGVHGVPVRVLAAVVGNHVGVDVITGAGFQALSIARSAMAAVTFVDVATRGQRVAVATAAGHTVKVVTGSAVSLLGWPGQVVTESLYLARRPRAGAPAGWRVGTVTAQVGPQKLTVPVVTGRRLPSPTFFQRVF